MRVERITSFQNPKIKEVISLHDKSRIRRESGKIVIEGVREVEKAINNGLEIISIFYSTRYNPDINIDTSYFELSQEVYDRISYRSTGERESIIAVAKMPKKGLQDIILSDKPLIIVLENIEKPGNIGAVLRTADAVKADAVIICNSQCDLFNPNVIRSSLGNIFTLPVIKSSSKEVFDWLISNKISIFTAQLQDSELYYECDMRGSSAFIMGSEADGLTGFWRDRATKRVRIPMLGETDSLNVSVSTAILCYEAIRQRLTLKD